MCKIKNVNKDIPFAILMRALGIQTDLKIFNCVCEKNISEVEGDDLQELKGMMEIVRYSIEQVKITEEAECMYLIGKYIDKLRGGENEASTII